MKKSLLALAGLALFSILVSSCSFGIFEQDIPEVQIGDITLKTNHPWIEEGVQDITVISNYETVIDVTKITGVLKAGDKFKVTWNAKSDMDIPAIYIRAVDNSEAANFWTELQYNTPEDTPAFVKKVKKGESFEKSKTFTLTADAIEHVALCIWAEKDVGAEPTLKAGRY